MEYQNNKLQNELYKMILPWYYWYYPTKHFPPLTTYNFPKKKKKKVKKYIYLKKKKKTGTN